MADINVTQEIIDINVTEEVVNIIAPSGGYPLPNTINSVFGRVGAIVATEGDYSLSQLSDVTLTSPANGQVLKYNGTQWVNNTDADTGITTLNTLTALTQSFATGTSGTDFNISSASSTHTFNFPSASATNRGLLTSADWSNFNSAYNDKINSAAVTGTTTKTLTLTQQDGGTVTASWSDLNTDAVTSVFGRTGAIVATSGDYTTTQVTEGTNLYYTDVRARASLSFVAGSGAYNSTTGVITIPTNNNQITNGSAYITLTGLSATSPLSYNNTTGVFTIAQATTSTDGYLSSTDWNTFNGKQNALTNPVTGTGTTNTLPKFTGTSAIGNSNISDNGSLVTIASALTLSGSVTGVGNLSNYTVTATAGSAISKKITSTLVAAANSDVLVGLDINPTFTLGAFTGTTSAALRVGGSIITTANLTYDIGTVTNNFNTFWGTSFRGAGNASLYSGGTTLVQGQTAIIAGLTYGIQFKAASSTQNAQVFSNGNWLLQQGGTFTDAGYKLDVTGTTRLNGLQTFVGTTASDGGQLGAELLTSSGWTSTGWTGSYPSFTHTTGNTTNLTNTLAAVTGASYAITYTITGRTAGLIAITFGSVSSGNVTATGTSYYKALNTNSIAVVPSTDFDGTVVISVKQITAGSATTTFQNSSGSANIEVRASGTSPTNTFIGLNSGRYNVTGGTQNTSLGSGALASILNATNNTAIGYNAGTLITTGNSNTLIGSNAGQNITAAGNSTIIGVNAGLNITTASGTTIVGSNAGTVITSNSNNTLIGQTAGNNIAGASNTALGFQALNGTGGSGNNNIAIGVQAGLSIFSGFNNVLVGNNAGNYFTTASNNIAIGNSAAAFAGLGIITNTNTTNSLYIGYGVRASALGATNEAVISAYNNLGGQVGYGSNTTVIGNNLTTNTAIQGNLSIGSLNPVSIGTTVATPSTTGGTLAAGTYYYQIVAVDIYGNTTTGSQEVSATTTGTTSSVGLTWTAVTNAASYRIYRGTATNAQNVYYTSATNSFTDINGTSTAGTVPTSNTTYLTRLNSAGSSVLGGTVNIGTNTSVASAALQIASTTQGFLPPTMTTTQKNAISSPATGLIVFDITLGKLCVYTGAAWQTITSV